jgi:hypothetical protein
VRAHTGAVRVEHRLDWGRTTAGKRFAVCSCGWRAPARSKLTHGMSDARDHLAAIRAQCAAQGWQWWMVKPLGMVTEEPDPESAGGELAGVVDQAPEVVRNPASVAPRSRAEIVAAKRAKEARRAARRAERVAPTDQGVSQVQSPHRAAR